MHLIILEVFTRTTQINSHSCYRGFGISTFLSSSPLIVSIKEGTDWSRHTHTVLKTHSWTHCLSKLFTFRLQRIVIHHTVWLCHVLNSNIKPTLCALWSYRDMTWVDLISHVNVLSVHCALDGTENIKTPAAVCSTKFVFIITNAISFMDNV